MNSTHTITSPLGVTALTDTELAEVVSGALGRPVHLGDWRVTALPVSSGAISTESVLHVHGTAFAGDAQLPWSVLVKVLRSPRHWPGIVMVPEPFRRTLIEDLPMAGGGASAHHSPARHHAAGHADPTRLPPRRSR